MLVSLRPLNSNSNSIIAFDVGICDNKLSFWNYLSHFLSSIVMNEVKIPVVVKLDTNEDEVDIRNICCSLLLCDCFATSLQRWIMQKKLPAFQFCWLITIKACNEGLSSSNLIYLFDLQVDPYYRVKYESCYVR